MFRDEYQLRSIFSEFDVLGGEYDVVIGIDEVCRCSCEDADDRQECRVCDLLMLACLVAVDKRYKPL